MTFLLLTKRFTYNEVIVNKRSNPQTLVGAAPPVKT